MSAFAHVVEQEEAKRLLRAALAEGPAHAYLFAGPPGVGKRTAAVAFAGALLGDPDRVARGAHPDLYQLEPLGDQIRIDAIRELRHDLHMRPFEAQRRVYLLLDADLMNEDAADALLKDLEEPPPYAVILLVASRVSRLPETVRSRCQLVPFRRLSRRAVEERVRALRPDLADEQAAAVSRVAAGRFDRAERLLDPAAASRRDALVALARSVYRAERFDPGAAARALASQAAEAGRHAAEADTERVELVGTEREREQRAKRVARGAERDEILESLDLLSGWFRDLLASSVGAAGAFQNADHADELAGDGAAVSAHAAERAVEAVADTRRSFELNVFAPLALEAMFIRLRQALGSAAVPGGVAG